MVNLNDFEPHNSRYFALFRRRGSLHNQLRQTNNNNTKNKNKKKIYNAHIVKH